MRLSISTHWNAFRHEDGETLVEEIRALGLDTIELGYDLTLDLVPGVRRAVERGDIRVCSVHNYCPVPVGAPAGHPELFLLGSKVPYERSQAISFTTRTIQFAGEIGAGCVVCHCGRAYMKPLTPKLIDLYEQNRRFEERTDKLRTRLIARREKTSRKALDHIRAGIEALLPELEKSNVKLCIENLPSWEAVPSEAELLELLREFDSPHLGYWHDIGHGQIRENLGFIGQVHWLRQLKDYLCGMHVHDVEFPAGDHTLPPLGSVDFSRFQEFLQSDTVLALEPVPGTPTERVRTAIEVLTPIWKLAD